MKVEDIDLVKDLTKSLKPLLIFGRMIGVVPLCGILTGRTADDLMFRYCQLQIQSSHWSVPLFNPGEMEEARKKTIKIVETVRPPYFSWVKTWHGPMWKSCGSILNCILCVCMVFNAVIGGIGFLRKEERGAQAMASNAQYCLLYSVALCNYLFFLLKGEEFLQLLKAWKAATFHFLLPDRNLGRDVKLIVFSIYSSIILENISWHVKHGLKIIKISENSNSTKPFLENFFARSAPMVASVLPYHPTLMAFIFLTNKLCLYAREFGDIFIIVISRAIYVKFKLLLEKADEELFQYEISTTDSKKWKNFISDYKTLLRILSSFEKFLSPLIFLSFCLNIYYISLRLCSTLQIQENLTTLDSLYANWAFAHGILRFYMVSLSAAKIHEHAMNIRSVLIKCPDELYFPEIQRFENQINNKEIGLSGFGSFTVTKSFMLKVVGVIFTVEIVLLQSVQSK